MAYSRSFLRDFRINVDYREFFLDRVNAKVLYSAVFLADRELVNLVQAYRGGIGAVGAVEDSSQLAQEFRAL